MIGFDPHNPTHLAAAWGAALLLWSTAARLGVRFATCLPPAAPTDLDTYGLACLAGGQMRLKEAALAALTARAARGSDTFTGRSDVVHPVEAALDEAATREAEWGAARARADGYREELVRLGLLHDPSRLWALAPAVVLTAAMMAGCMVMLARLNPPGGSRGSIGMTLANAFGLCGTIFLFGLLKVGRIRGAPKPGVCPLRSDTPKPRARDCAHRSMRPKRLRLNWAAWLRAERQPKRFSVSLDCESSLSWLELCHAE